MNGTNNTVLRSYVWGLDLSGIQTGAGGVGGLIMMNSVQNGTHFFAYDGNGNVSALVNASNGEVTANYEYGPYGEPIRVSGIMSRENPFRFSTKRTVDSIDIILYEYRPYKPSTGTWLTRDPIGERGGENLYGFTLNNPIIYIDTDGRSIGNTAGPIYGQWYRGYHRGTGPKQTPDPIGFALCIREVNPEGLVEHLLLIGFKILYPGAPTDHAYLHYKHCNRCERIGYGIGGTRPGSLPNRENKFNPSDCKPCKRTGSILQYGQHAVKGTDATDSEILDCISKVPTSKPYKPIGINKYNCFDWAKEAANKCGLDCN